MMRKVFIVLLTVLMMMSCTDKPITMNLYYTGENGNARRFVEEMESSGTADAIRAEEGNLRYDYFFSKDDYYLKSHLFGDIFAGDQLSAADREIVTVAALSGLEGVTPQLAAHKQGAVNMGNSQSLVDELSAWLDAQGYTLHSKWPKGEANPYGAFFSGRSYLADVGGGVMNVTFEPGCRNNWHIHHGQVQVLICVAGRGWYQEWGKDAVEMTPGTVIAVPAEVKHWHGAAKDSWFQHLTYHKDVQEGASNEWLEPVDDMARM